MTHEELLAKIKREEDYLKTYAEGYGFVVTDALRAVVELHKPSEAWGDTHCGFCFDLAWEPSGLEMMDKHFAYPCLTIQAIEKELS
jgi:hypothetical protein